MMPIVLDVQETFNFPLEGVRLIEASAGTGKTYTIANLYLRHIVEGREVGEVLVVTFTEAATDELRGRIRARLFEALDLLERSGKTEDPFLDHLVRHVREQGIEEQTTRRLRLTVRSMDEAAIYTIHGFCQRSLSEFAFHSGQQFQMEVLTDDSELWRQAIRDWWRQAGYRLGKAQARLFVDGLEDPDTFEGLLKPLLDPQERRLLPKPTSLASLLAQWDAIAQRLRALAVDWSRNGEKLKQILRNSKGLSRAKTSAYHPDRLEPVLEILDGYFASGETLPPPEGFEVLTPQCMQMKKHCLKTQDPDLGNSFFVMCGEIWRDLLALKRDLRAAALADAGKYTREKVHEAKQRAQVLSFNDLLSEMHQALNGGNGPALAKSVRERFPVAMIDEFQDTDPIQYEIFRILYLGQPGCGLILIGDPKQAIYSFRGGDIFTYMQAKADVGDAGVYTLDTNWRSTPEVIDAVNAVFQRRTDAFVYSDTIPFHPVHAAKKIHRHLTRDDKHQAALNLWVLPSKDNGKPLGKDEARRVTHRAVADEIARLIEAGRSGKALLDDQPLRPRDIAVLVRSSFEAADLRKVLTDAGVNAVSVERTGVFNTGEAAALEGLLEAVINPRDRELARLALASSLRGKGYAEIGRITQDDEDWIRWLDALGQLNQTWQRKGFMAMFQQMLRTLRIAEAIGREALAERRLTNLLHLGELLQQASQVHPGMDALLSWYRHRRSGPTTEEAELRLESDEELVQIVTIHASKGLEYPVVFAPYLWGCKPRDTEGLLAFHLDQEACLDAGSDDIDRHLRLAEKERLAEDARLAYVALTRAESCLYLVWGNAGSRDGRAGQTALAYLLHPTQRSADLSDTLPDAFTGSTNLMEDLRRLANANTVVSPLPQPETVTVLQQTGEPRALELRRFHGRVATDWRVQSFSALTREVHSGPAVPRDQVANDPALRFPAGSHVGSYLHLLLEHLDFQGDVAQQVERLSAQLAPRFNLDHSAWGGLAAQWLERVIQTSLDGQGLTLGRLSLEKRLNELEFDFSTHRVDIKSLNTLLEKAAGRPLDPLEIQTFQGMVTGIIDLVFEYEGRFYIVDYKSNFLGGRLSDYDQNRLRQAVYERRYDLQYLLYTLALHRYLRYRTPDYRYDSHFGGVYYLFLRGMHPRSGSEYGVYFDLPNLDLIEALDHRVFDCGMIGP